MAGELGHDTAGHQATENARNGMSHQQQSRDLCLLIGRKPIGQAQHHPRQEAGFCHAQYQTCEVELVGGSNEQGERGDRPPKHHDPQQGTTYALLVQVNVLGTSKNI